MQIVFNISHLQGGDSDVSVNIGNGGDIFEHTMSCILGWLVHWLVGVLAGLCTLHEHKHSSPHAGFRDDHTVSTQPSLGARETMSSA